jgi:type IV fimbrial biogenesis protein FimT
MRSCPAVQRRNAFSLIELMLVIAIMGVIAAMAAPRYGDALNRYRADAAARRISADLVMAQARARDLATSRTIVFSRVSGSYTIAGERDFTNSASNYTVDLTAKPYGVSIGTVNFGGNPSISFDGFGAPSGAGSILISAGGVSRIIRIDSGGGTPTIQ